MNVGVDFSIAQFRDAWRLFCSGCPGKDFSSRDGVEYIFSGLPIAFFNVALITGSRVSGDALDANGRAACGFASERQLPWLFIVTHEALDPGVDAAATLDRCGLVPMLPLTGMVAEHIADGRASPEELDITEPRDDSGCATVMDVNAAAYGVDLDASKPVFTPSFWADHVPVLGRVGGEPATSAAVLMVNDCRYVALVATDPGHQRRGYGEAAMRHALSLAASRHGERMTVLHATDAGRPIYARMGYETIATHTAFIERRFLEGH